MYAYNYLKEIHVLHGSPPYNVYARGIIPAHARLTRKTIKSGQPLLVYGPYLEHTGIPLTEVALWQFRWKNLRQAIIVMFKIKLTSYYLVITRKYLVITSKLIKS